MFQRTVAHLIPNFLKEIDQRLLTSYPYIWVTKIHYVLYFGSLTMLLAIVGALLTRIALPHLPNIDERATLLAIPLTVAFCIWVYQAGKFNIRNAYGTISPQQQFKQLLIYIGAISVFIMIPIVHLGILQYRIGQTVSTSQLVQDIPTFQLTDWSDPVLDHFLASVENAHEAIPKTKLTTAELEKTIHTIQYYGNIKQISNEDLLAYITSLGNEATNYHDINAQQTLVTAYWNILHIAKAKQNPFFFLSSFILTALFIGAIALLCLMALIWQNGWKSLARTAIVLMLFTFVAILLTSMFYSLPAFQNTPPTSMLASFFLLIWGILLWSSRTVSKAQWKVIALNGACLMTPLVPILFLILYDNTFSVSLFAEHLNRETFSSLLLSIGAIVSLISLPFYLKRIQTVRTAPIG